VCRVQGFIKGLLAWFICVLLCLALLLCLGAVDSPGSGAGVLREKAHGPARMAA
jgi:hypothetical protein